MKLLCISIEFTAGTFSGNGIYCISQVRALSRLGHEVLVLCGKPEGHKEAPRLEGAAGLLEVELPVWGRLDAGCAWRQFAAGAGALAEAVAAFCPEACLGVDWHSLAAYEALEGALEGRLAPYVFMNYRVYLRTAEGEEAVLLKEMERRALHRSLMTTVLSRSDAQYLGDACPREAAERELHVLLPALRSDMAGLPMPHDVAQQAQQPKGHAQQSTEQPSPASEQQQQQQQQQLAVAGAAGPQQPGPPVTTEGVRKAVNGGRGRHLLTCAVRISPEKEPQRFLGLAVELSRRGVLAKAGVTPLMFGAGWGSEYGRELRERVERELPECIILDTFMGPADLAAIYSATLLNVHPCLYDAYGMTIVEAASQGAPSLIKMGGHVGATDLLDASQGEAICMDLSRQNAELAADVEALLSNPRGLAQVGVAAARKARSWTEAANAQTLVELVQQALQQAGAPV